MGNDALGFEVGDGVAPPVAEGLLDELPLSESAEEDRFLCNKSQLSSLPALSEFLLRMVSVFQPNSQADTQRQNHEQYKAHDQRQPPPTTSSCYEIVLVNPFRPNWT